MRTHHTLIALAACGAAAGALAQQQPEMGRVLSSQPVVQQVAVQQPVCAQQQVLAEGPRSGAGAVMGAIAGGALGNAIGGGSGRAAATALGLLGGAVLGDRVEGGGQPQWQTVQNCGTQTSYENRTVGYDVTYEYAGQRYTTRTQSDPGAWIPVQVSAGYAPPPVQPQAAVYDVQPGVVVPQYQAVQPIAYAPAPVVVAPPPVYYGGPVYPRSYYGAPPVGLSLNFGYVHRGGHRHGHGHRHWR